MNPLEKVTGTWRGVYSYDASEDLPRREPIGFTLTLKQGWFGRFMGTVVEDAGRGMPGIGVVEGSFAFPRVRFIKRMPVCYMEQPDGRVITLREMLLERGERCERDVPHAPILYRGEFVDARKAQGAWVIRAGPLLSLPDGRVVATAEVTGSWTIENAG